MCTGHGQAANALSQLPKGAQTRRQCAGDASENHGSVINTVGQSIGNVVNTIGNAAGGIIPAIIQLSNIQLPQPVNVVNTVASMLGRFFRY